MQIRIPNTDKIGEGFLLGIGAFAAYVILRGLLKMADQYSGGVIPDEFVAAASYPMYGTEDDGSYSEY